jgi:flagellar protein FliO/FliZ
MTQSLLSVGIFLAVLACLPMAIKWLRQRSAGEPKEAGGQSRVVSAIAVGPHQRVVTVEVGPDHARVMLVLGVTVQSITCLHSVSMATSDRTQMDQWSDPVSDQMGVKVI